MSSKRKGGLGKGLSALLENAETDITSKKGDAAKRVVGSVAKIPVSEIETNPFQPRTEFEKEALLDLAASIKQHGIIQPLTVRKIGVDQYQLISGERRFRASEIAGLEEVPAYIRIANDQEMLEMALVENIQRENLNAIEVALSYQRLIDECKLTQEQLSKKVAKNRTTVTNHLRLLKLPAEIQLGIKDKKISMGHARALVGVQDEHMQITLYNKTVKENLSVRQVEELIRKINQPTPKKAPEVKLSEEEQELLTQFNDILDTPVSMKKGNNGKGKIVIDYRSIKELKRILGQIQES